MAPWSLLFIENAFPKFYLISAGVPRKIKVALAEPGISLMGNGYYKQEKALPSIILKISLKSILNKLLKKLQTSESLQFSHNIATGSYCYFELTNEAK